MRLSRLRVEPDGEPAFEVSGSFRYPNMAAEIDLAGTGLGSAGSVDEASREEMLEEAKKWTEAFPDPNAKTKK